MIATHAGPARQLPCGWLNKIGGEEADMPEIDLVNWTIQEAQHLNAERREPIEVNDKSSVEQLLAVLKPELMGRTDPEDSVALIASISATVEEPVARRSNAIVADTKRVAGPDQPVAASAVSAASS
jgi:hypothetical protein